MIFTEIEKRHAWFANLVDHYYMTSCHPLAMYNGTLIDLQTLPDEVESKVVQDIHGGCATVTDIVGDKISIDYRVDGLVLHDGTKADSRIYYVKGVLMWMKECSKKDLPTLMKLETAFRVPEVHELDTTEVATFFREQNGSLVLFIKEINDKMLITDN